MNNPSSISRALPTERFTHPEIELRLKKFPVPIEDWRALSKPTLIDILEVYSDGRCAMSEDLGAAELMAYAQAPSETRSTPTLRLIFLNGIDREALHPLGNTAKQAQDSTANIIHHTFGTPISFFRYLTPFGSSPRVGRSLFVRKSKDGQAISLDGIYQVSDRKALNWYLCHVWFSQSFDPHQCSNYVVHGVPPTTKKLMVECAKGKTPGALLRPFSVHAFIQDSCAHSLFQEYVVIDSDIHRYVSPCWPINSTPATPLEPAFAFQETSYFGDNRLEKKDDVKRLLSQSKSTKMLLAHAERCKRTSEYLITSLEKHAILFTPLPEAQYWEKDTVIESLAQLSSRVDDLTSSALTLDERIRYLIDLAYNEISQANNAINLDIARLTTNIAVAAQQDSSSMITMAAVTMFFLPGTFVSALFSMTFFNTTDNGSLELASQGWIFLVITIPLTFIVFVIWYFWKRYRAAKSLRELASLRESAVEPGSPTTVVPLASKIWPLVSNKLKGYLSRLPESVGTTEKDIEKGKWEDPSKG